MTTKNNFEIGDKCWFIEHNVYGNPNGPVNEPYTIPGVISKIEGKNYTISGTNTFGVYTKSKKYIFETKDEADEYINEHRNEIISKSFDEHNKWLKEQRKKIRRYL